jgi:cytochrome c-type biogenesis protein CcmH
LVGSSDSSKVETPSVVDEQAALEARKAELLEELKELEAGRAALKSDVYDERRSEIVSQGARVVEAISTAGGPSDPRKSEGLWLVGVGIAAFLLFVIIFAKEAAQPRMDGEGMTGGGAVGQTSTPQRVDSRTAALDAEVESALATLEADPHDIEALNFLTHQAIMSGELAAAMQWSTTARELVPEDADVIVHSAALAMRVGMQELALERLMSVLEQEPTHLEARWWMAVAIANTGDFLGSKEAVAPLLGISGEYGQLANLLTIDLDMAMANQATGSVVASDSSGGSVADQEPAGDVYISGSIELASGVESPRGGTLFVAAVRSPNGGGPPLAARRYNNASLPIDFTLGPSDSPLPGEWPEQFWVRARVDTDGDPASVSSGELTSELYGPVSIGDEVVLTLAAAE